MIISEKQIFQLMEIARTYLEISEHELNIKLVTNLLSEIHHQQSEELKEIK